MPPLAYCAPALGNTAKQNDAIRFTIPPAWLRHAVPPLHKGGCGVPPAQCLGCHIALPVASRRCHTALPRPAAEFSWLACFASQSPLAWLRHAVPPLHKGGFSLPGWTQPAFSVALGTGGGPAWGAKKVGEKLSFSPRGPVAGQPYFLCPGKHNRPRQRKYGSSVTLARRFYRREEAWTTPAAAGVLAQMRVFWLKFYTTMSSGFR